MHRPYVEHYLVYNIKSGWLLEGVDYEASFGGMV